VLKGFDRASPKLLRAAFTGESLTVEIIWYMSISGVVKQTTTVKLEGALISNIDAAANLTANSANAFEEVSLSYSRITFTVPSTDKSGATTLGSVCLDVVSNKGC